MWERVKGEDGETAKGYPSCLGEEGAKEFGGGFFDFVNWESVSQGVESVVEQGREKMERQVCVYV